MAVLRQQSPRVFSLPLSAQTHFNSTHRGQRYRKYCHGTRCDSQLFPSVCCFSLVSSFHCVCVWLLLLLAPRQSPHPGTIRLSLIHLSPDCFTCCRGINSLAAQYFLYSSYFSSVNFASCVYLRNVILLCLDCECQLDGSPRLSIPNLSLKLSLTQSSKSSSRLPAPLLTHHHPFSTLQ